MGISHEEVTRQLVECEFMTVQEATAFLESLPPDRDAPTELVARKLLTEFQASALGSGKLATLVLGNYIVQERLGQGGMGLVFLAKHRRMKRVVALKALSPSLTFDNEAVHRFQREVELLARLQHPNIATAYDADEARGVHYLVMEYVAGCDLASLVRRDGALSVRKAVNYARQAACGLAYAHREGVIHRDVKPSNLQVDRTGTVKILDLGLGRLVSTLRPGNDEPTETDLTAFSAVMGTAAYMSPEQALDTKHADARSDVYSLGCTLHYMLTGRPVVAGETAIQKLMAHREQKPPRLTATRSDVPASLDAVFQKMVAKSPADRYQTMDEVAAALDRELTALPESPAASCSVAGAAAAGPARRKRVVAALLIVLLGAAAVTYAVRKLDDTEAHKQSNVGQKSTNVGQSLVGTTLDPHAPLLAAFLPETTHRSFVNAVAFTNDGTEAIVAGGFVTKDTAASFPVLIRQLPEGNVLRRFDDPVSWVNGLAVSSDGVLLVAATGGSWKTQEGGTDYSVFVWDLATGDRIARFTEHSSTVRTVALFPDGELAISGGYDDVLRLWSTRTGEHRETFDNTFGDVLSLTVAPGGRKFVSGHWGCALLWDLETGDWEHQFPVPGALALTVAFSHDGARLACGASDRLVRVWDVAERTLLADLTGHEERVTGVAWLPDGRRLVSSSEDKTVRLWNAQTKQQLARFDGHREQVKCVTVSPDGQRALSGGADGSVYLWRLPAAEAAASEGE